MCKFYTKFHNTIKLTFSFRPLGLAGIQIVIAESITEQLVDSFIQILKS